MPKVVHKEVMCCGHKRCPTIEVFDDGSITVSDDDVQNESIGQIKFRPEVVARLRELLLKKYDG